MLWVVDRDGMCGTKERALAHRGWIHGGDGWLLESCASASQHTKFTSKWRFITGKPCNQWLCTLCPRWTHQSTWAPHTWWCPHQKSHERASCCLVQSIWPALYLGRSSWPNPNFCYCNCCEKSTYQGKGKGCPLCSKEEIRDKAKGACFVSHIWASIIPTYILSAAVLNIHLMPVEFTKWVGCIV